MVCVPAGYQPAFSVRPEHIAEEDDSTMYGEKSMAIRNEPRRWVARVWVCAATASGIWSTAAPAQVVSVAVANHSFESPTTTFAFPDATDWDETGPVGQDPQLPGVIDTLDTGVFFNSPVDSNGAPSPFFITNADGMQLGFIGAADNLDIAFLQQLDIVYETGAAYTLRLDVGESFFFPPSTVNPNDPDPPPNPPPALLAVRLYYLDAMQQRITLAERVVSDDEMPGGPDTGVLLVEFAATTGFLASGSAPVGQSVGIEIRPVLGLSGVWNLDNARLSVDCGAGGVPGDTDLDGDVDATDYDAFSKCLGGPQSAPPVGCSPCALGRSDSDGDGDIDLRDFAALAAGFTG